MKTILLLTSFLLLSINLIGQNTYTLNANNASGIINSNGVLFENISNVLPGYGMLSDSGAMGIFFSAFWIAGFDDNDTLHTCVTNYIGSDLKSGPIAQSYFDVNYLNTYDQKIWTVTSDEIAYHISHYNSPGYIMPDGILNWPAHGNVGNGEAPNLAQFVDVNTNSIYEPHLGDYPLILGDEMVYLIFNDDDAYSPTHTMGFEYHFMLYQYATNDDYINNTTFLRLTIFNRSSQNYHNVRVANMTDFDIGGYTDDFIGCDSTRNLMFGYNADPIDDAGAAVILFGANPPAYGVMQLNQPMDVAMFYDGVGNTPNDYWLRMNGFLNGSIHLTYGGNGFGGTVLTNYQYSGNPYTQTGWSEVTAQMPGQDVRMLMSTGNGNLAPGESVCVDYAFIYARNGGDYLANVNALYSVADTVKNFYNSITGFYCPDGNILLNTQQIIPPKKDILVYPNPNTGQFNINFNGVYNLKIYNSNGQLIKSINNLSYQSQIDINVDAGLYILQIENKDNFYYQKMIVE